jgi:hypothetical protein
MRSRPTVDYIRRGQPYEPSVRGTFNLSKIVRCLETVIANNLGFIPTLQTMYTFG